MRLCSVPLSEDEVRLLLWLFPSHVALVVTGVWLGDVAALATFVLILAVLLTWVPPLLAVRSIQVGPARLWTYLGFGYGILGLFVLWYLAQAVATELSCDLTRWVRMRLFEALFISAGLLLSRTPRPALAWPLALGGSVVIAYTMPQQLFAAEEVLASLAGSALLLAFSLRQVLREDELPAAGWLVSGMLCQLASILVLLAFNPERAEGAIFAVAATLSVGGNVLVLLGLIRAMGTTRVPFASPGHAPSASPTGKPQVVAALLSGNVSCALVDTRLRILGANPAFAHAVGHDCADLSYRRLVDLDLGSDLDKWCRRALQQQRTQLFDSGHGVRARTRSHGWMGTVQPVPGSTGQIEHLLISLVDVPRTPPDTPSSWQSEECYRAILEYVSDAVIICDLQGRIYDVNGVAESIAGQERGRLIGMTVFDIHPVQCHARIDAAFEMLRREVPIRLELPLLRCDGPAGHVEVAAASFVGGEGRMALATLRDITGRKLAEERLRQSEARWRAVFEHGGMGIVLLDKDGNWLKSNAAFKRMCGFGPDEQLTDIAWGNLVVDSPALHEVAAEDNPYLGRHRMHCRCGGILWVDLTLTVVRQQDGDVAFFIAMLMDVTDAHQAEMERNQEWRSLVQHQRELEQANKHKSRFIATASHDIRQPIQAISILSHLIDERSLDEQDRDIVKRIRDAVTNLGDMVGSLLDLSKLDAGLIVPEMAAVSLAGILRIIEKEFQPLARAKGLYIDVDTATDLWVRSDRHLLTRIVRNVVANAIRYTERGGVQLLVHVEDASAVIEIADTGVGIPEHDFRRIFGEFQQLPNCGCNRSEGLGLGLVIVDQLAQLLGIRIALESQVGIGTAFSLWIPLSVDGTNEVREPDEHYLAAQRSCNALVLEHDADIRTGLVLMLRHHGYQVIEADCCGAMLDDAGELAGDPDLIVADYRLPDGNGLEVITKLRARVGRLIPAVVLTGDTQPEVQAEIAAAGCKFVSKPASVPQLRSAITSALNHPG